MNALDVLLGVAAGNLSRRTEPGDAGPRSRRGRIETGSPAETIRADRISSWPSGGLRQPTRRIGVAISDVLPEVSRSARCSGSATAISSGNLFTSDARQTQGVLGLRWRLFDFGRVDAQIAAAPWPGG
jgi:outer membrane protein TolC